LGGNFFPDKSIQIFLVYPGSKDSKLEDYGLEASQQYLFPVKPSTEFYELSNQERIFNFISFPKNILIIKNNFITKNITITPKRSVHYDYVTNEKIYDFMFKNNTNTVSIEEADQILLDNIYVKENN
jgi:hypothetical protein